MQITHIQKCVCGAITVWYDNGASNSMFQSTFELLSLDTSDAEKKKTSSILLL